MGSRFALATLALMAVTVNAQMPSSVRQLAEKAGVTAPIVAWCRGEFRAGQQGYALAAGGRYLVIEGRGGAVELGAFKDKPDLACYSRDEALKLHGDIQRSETLSGAVAPRFGTAVICGFIDATSATCWQYSPAQKAYVKVGSWTT